jgi:hypothetical protein
MEQFISMVILVVIVIAVMLAIKGLQTVNKEIKNK